MKAIPKAHIGQNHDNEYDLQSERQTIGANQNHHIKTTAIMDIGLTIATKPPFLRAFITIGGLLD